MKIKLDKYKHINHIESNDLKCASFNILMYSDEYCGLMLFPNAQIETNKHSDVFYLLRSWRFSEHGTAIFKNYKFSPHLN